MKSWGWQVVVSLIALVVGSIVAALTISMLFESCRERHCPTSKACESYGACINDGPYRCVTGCEELCNTEGLCTPDRSSGELNCIAKFNDCKETKVCEDFGRCSAVNGYCIPTTDEQCQQSTECGTIGRCKVKNNECMPKSAIDCARSWECIFNNRCFFKDGERSYCGYPGEL